MSVINSGTFAKALWPGVNKWYGEAYNDYEPQWTPIFSKESSNKQWEEDVGLSGFGYAVVKPEGNGISYDTVAQGFTTRYSHVVYGLGFVVTREAYEDDQYGIVAKKRAKALARSMRLTKDVIAANILNRAFTSGYTGGDGSTLCSTSHPNVTGGTWSNQLAIAANLSEAALEQMNIDIMKFTDDRGLKIAVRPRQLIIPPDLVFEAERILKTEGRVGTNNNDLNALKSMGKVSKIVVNQYLTSTTAFWLQTDTQDGLKYFERRADQFDMDNEFDTENAKYKATARFSFGWTDPRCVYGTPGV
jgi:phage major head subunit gpT-like protein